MGKPTPGFDVSIVDDDGIRAPPGERRPHCRSGEARASGGAVPGVLARPRRDRRSLPRRLVPDRRSRDASTRTATSGSSGAPMTSSSRPATGSGPSRSSARWSSTRRLPKPPWSASRTRREGRSSRHSWSWPPAGRHRTSCLDVQDHVKPRDRPLQVPKRDRVRCGPAQDRLGQDPQGGAARASSRGIGVDATRGSAKRTSPMVESFGTSSSRPRPHRSTACRATFRSSTWRGCRPRCAVRTGKYQVLRTPSRSTASAAWPR